MINQPAIKKSDLTKREKLVLKLICEEKTNLEIAKLLKISIRTAERHKTNLTIKINSKTVIGLFKWAVRHRMAKVFESKK